MANNQAVFLVGDKMSASEQFFVSFILFILLVFCTTRFHRKQRKLLGKTSFHQVLPRVQNTFTNLFIVDGIINLLKVKRGGFAAFDQMISKYGQNFRCTLAHMDFVLVSDPNIIKKLLSSTNSGHLNKYKTGYKLLFTERLMNSLLISDVDIWSSHRKTISRAFTYKELQKYTLIIDEEMQLLARSAHFIAKSENGLIQQKQVRELLEDHAVAAAVGLFFGSESRNECEKERAEFHKAFKRAAELVTDRLKKPHLIFQPIWMLHRNRRELDHLAEIMNHFCIKMIESYRKKQFTKAYENNANNIYSLGETNESKYSCNYTLDTVEQESRGGSESVSGCLIEQMIMAGDSDREILDEVNMFMVVGYETILTAIHFLWFHLAANTYHQAKCREEVDMLMDGEGWDQENEILTMEHLSELKYLERCILESMRLIPPVPAFARQIEAPLELDDDYVIEPGQNILILPWALHRNPEIFPNPHKFDPDRFLPEMIKERHTHAFIPFSMGPRNCIGFKLAMLEMKVILARILRRFELTTTDKPEDMKIMFGVILEPTRPFNVTFKVREH